MLLSGQLAEAISNDEDPSDEEILSAAAEIAKADPKKRFGAQAVKQQVAKHRGVERMILKTPIERRIASLVTAGKVVADRVRGFYKLTKVSGDADGLAFRNAGGGGFDILFGGEYVGSITIDDGDFISGSSRQREKVYVIDVDVEGHDFTGANAPPEFKKLGDAKKWLKARLG